MNAAATTGVTLALFPIDHNVMIDLSNIQMGVLGATFLQLLTQIAKVE